MLGSEDVQAYLDQHQIAGEIVFMPTDTPTVEHAAQALGVQTDQIAKSLVFLVGSEPILVIACGTARVDKTKLAVYLNVSKAALKFAAPQQVLAETGFSVGTMPPFAHQRRLRTLLDGRVLDQNPLFAGGGSINSMLRILPQELLRATAAEVAQVV